MRLDLLTLFPEFFDSPLKSSILGRAIASGRIVVHLHDIRDWATDRHRTADDAPYGGGGGMVMKAEPVVKAARAVKQMTAAGHEPSPVIYLTPQGEPLTASRVRELAALPGVILLCGNYEGIDERAIDLVVDREISIGDYVLTGGEVAALVLLNAVARRLPGVLGNEVSAARDSFEEGLLDYPHYTRPEVFEGLAVPAVLLGGNHAQIEAWRRQEALARTLRRRPDLLKSAHLTDQDRRRLGELEDPRRAQG